MRLDVFRISPFAARVTFKPAPQQRPPSVGPALAATLSMLHLDRLRFEVGEFTRRDARARASQLAAAALAHARSEGTKQALAVLASVNHLSNVAGTLERAGETIRGLGELGLRRGLRLLLELLKVRRVRPHKAGRHEAAPRRPQRLRDDPAQRRLDALV